MAKKPVPPSDVIDYDIVEFSCPATVSSSELVELRVQVVNVGPADPGVILQAREEDALLGPTLVVNEVVYDNIEKGKRQKPTEYIYYVSPTYQQTYIQWSVNLYDENHDDDLDWAFCNTQILWN
jgi:hypothetical protein